MKQIIQDLKSGSTILEEVPVPQVKSGYVLNPNDSYASIFRTGAYARGVRKGEPE